MSDEPLDADATPTGALGRYSATTLRLGEEVLHLGRRPLVMGVLNVTPDSFSDGGSFLDPDRAVAHAEEMVERGADWIDVGAESTRPGAEPVSVDEEIRRLEPILDRLGGRVSAPISIDTCKPPVARFALDAGVRIINDVTGFRDPEMLEVAAGSDAACVLMHMRGTPRDMMSLADYDDVVGELETFFGLRLETLLGAGVARERILLDPGIGFAKRRDHNTEVLRSLDRFHRFGRPLLLGVSRKRIIAELSGESDRERLAGTIAACLLGYLRGVHVLRVHEVGPIADALRVARGIEAGPEPEPNEPPSGDATP